MTKYRIVEKKIAADDFLRTRYCIEYKSLFFFWKYIDDYNNIESAEKRVSFLLQREELKKQESTKVVKIYD